VIVLADPEVAVASLAERVVDDSIVPPSVHTDATPVLSALADMTAVVALVTDAIVVAAGIPLPEIDMPTSCWVKFAVADVIVADAPVREPSATERLGALSIFAVNEAVAVAAALMTPVHGVPVVMLLRNERAGMPVSEPTRETGWLIHGSGEPPWMPSQADNVTLAEPFVIPKVTLRAAPLCHTAESKSWMEKAPATS